MASVPDSILKALYTINKLAKQYGKTATNAYKSGFGADAKYNSLRKDALYQYKATILERLYKNQQVDSVSHHIINNRDYYCFYIDGYSFHTPIENFGVCINCTEKEDISDEFESSASFQFDGFSEKQAIQILDFSFDISPNDCLTRSFISRYYEPEYIGWTYASNSAV